jgi:hypothetical protein
VPGAVLGVGSNVKHHDVALLEALVQLGRRQQLDLVPRAQVFARRHGHLRDVTRSHVANGRPQVGHPIAGEPVEDAI